MDFAELVMTANTKGLKKGEDDLDDLVKAGDRAERSTKSQTDGMGRSYRSFASMAGKALGGLVAGIGAYQIAASGLASARSFDAALAETSTLIDGTAAQMQYLDDKAVQLARTFGGDATAQVQGFYQAISAGAASVEDAGVVLDAANALAKGGITSVSTAVGVLSGVVNTFGADVINVGQVSDSLFVGMKAGVTTIDQLANSIGTVLPLASAMGLSFDETVAATAALTKNNLTTSAAVTSLNAALTAISGPTSEAQKLAAELGLEFNSAALEAKGFGAFMADVTAKTGGGVDAMRTLFGSVEGMKAALLFAGEAGGQFSDIMVDMENKLGQTDIAVAKISDSLSDRLDNSLNSLSLMAMEFGQVLLTVAVPALEAVVGVATLVSDNFEVLGVALAFVAATQIPVMITGLVAMVGTMTTAGAVAGALTAAIGGLKVALALLGGPLGIAIGLVGAAAAAFLLMRDDAGEAETAMYDAKAGTEALNLALNDFATSGAPSAGAAAIALANDNYALADSAYAVAAAELEKQKSLLQIASTSGVGGTSGSIRDMGMSASGQAADYEAALARITQAEIALGQALRDRGQAETTVNGSSYGGIIPPAGSGITPTTRPDGLGSGTGSGGGGGGTNATIEERNELQEEGKRITEALKTEQERLNDALEQADRLYAAGALSQEAYTEHTANLKEELAQLEFGNVIDGLTRISDAMIDAIVAGDNLLDSFVRVIQQMAIEALKADIASLISGMFGGPTSPSVGILGMAFGGARANGGGVDPAKAYMVGENGPELFKPQTFGTILSNSESGPASRRMAAQQGSAPNVNVSAAPVEVVVLDDPRRIDEYRTSPQGEKARNSANRRLQNA